MEKYYFNISNISTSTSARIGRKRRNMEIKKTRSKLLKIQR
jgi:hypothetical protein